MSFLHSMTKEIRVHGKHRMYGLEASTVFRNLSQYPPVLGEDDQSNLEKFVVIMYDMFSANDSIDEARLEMFARKQVI